MTESASPAEEYLNALERVCSIAYPLSPLSHGVWGRTDIARLADRIFARMLVTASSLVRLCRCDQPVGSLPAWVDLTAQANLARSILEAYEALDYLVLEHVGREEGQDGTAPARRIFHRRQ